MQMCVILLRVAQIAHACTIIIPWISTDDIAVVISALVVSPALTWCLARSRYLGPLT